MEHSQGKKVLVAGSAVVDVVIHVDHLPHRGEDINVYGQTMSLGGCAYNVSDCLRHFGVPFIPFYPVGTGVYGDFVRAHLLERGIVSAAPSPSSENGCCYCFVQPDGERTFICYHGAEYRFQPGWFDTLEASEIGSVYLCGLEVEEDTGVNMIEYLERHPEFTIYFAPSARICNIATDKMDRLLALHPILHLNEDEATRFTKMRFASDGTVSVEAEGTAPAEARQSREGEERPEDAGKIWEEELHEIGRKLTSLTGNVVIITLGSRGCFLSYPKGYRDPSSKFFSGSTTASDAGCTAKSQHCPESELIPACRLPEIHGGDAIGAGDSHIGSVIALRQLGYSFHDAVRLANRVSAAVVCTDGALLADEHFRELNLH